MTHREIIDLFKLRIGVLMALTAVAARPLGTLGAWTGSSSFALNLAAIACAGLAAALVAGIVGIGFEPGR